MAAAKPVILILTTYTGGGHLNLAQSLKHMLEPHYDIVISNPQSPFIGSSYTFFIRHFQPFLHWQYALSDCAFAAFWLHRITALGDSERFDDVIASARPQLIIVTHAMLSYAAARAIERVPQRVPLVFQLTDLAELHMTWFTEQRADAYLAPTKEIVEQALRVGIARERLHLTGRPVRSQFLMVQPERCETLAALGLDPAVLTIFLQGGANGSAATERTIRNLLGAGVPVQIILAVGNNQKMAQRYSGMKQVRVLPFTEVIAPYMAAADVIAGKAGASFITEAFMLERPFLATAYVRGQETPNLRFIEQHNLGWVCLKTSAQQQWLRDIAHNPALIAEQRKAIQAYKALNMQANQAIVPLIDRLSRADG